MSEPATAPRARTYDPNNAEEVFRVLGEEIEAAKLKVALDRRLGRKTSESVIELSQLRLPEHLGRVVDG